ncbi:MAG TPA: hypothetical protein DCS93_06460 [Microscillaceae bacterium]|nr:hypothetical protein [Microscillaceae bacterium]
MKWNTLYHLYEGGALLGIMCCWGMIVFTSPANEPTQWQSFNRTLEMASARATWNETKRIQLLQPDISKSGNSREGFRIEKLSTRTNAVIQYLENTKDYLRSLPPNLPLQGDEWLLKINQAKVKMDDQVSHLRESYEDLQMPQFDYIADGTKNNPLYKGLPDKDFAHNYFEGTLPAEAMAILTQKQLTLRRFTIEVLKKTGSCVIGPWQIEVVRPQAQTPAATYKISVGDEYTADMFIGASARETNPRMILNGKSLSVRSGSANIRFETKEIGPQFWEGKVVYKHKGRYKTITHKVPFEVWSKSEH